MNSSLFILSNLFGAFLIIEHPQINFTVILQPYFSDHIYYLVKYHREILSLSDCCNSCSVPVYLIPGFFVRLNSEKINTARVKITLAAAAAAAELQMLHITGGLQEFLSSQSQ